MYFESAIQSHVEWRSRFWMAIRTGATFDVQKTGGDCHCDVGRWLHGEGKRLYRDLPAYRECLERHAEFHREAAKVAVAVNAGDAATTETMLGIGTPYSRASTGCVGALRALASEIGA